MSRNLDHWHAAVKPRRCNLHQQYHDNAVVLLRHPHWSHWGKRHARGKAKEILKGGESTKARIKLHRSRWGTFSHHTWRFFSRAKITDRFGSRILKLDVPTSNVLPG